MGLDKIISAVSTEVVLTMVDENKTVFVTRIKEGSMDRDTMVHYITHTIKSWIKGIDSVENLLIANEYIDKFLLDNNLTFK